MYIPQEERATVAVVPGLPRLVEITAHALPVRRMWWLTVESEPDLSPAADAEIDRCATVPAGSPLEMLKIAVDVLGRHGYRLVREWTSPAGWHARMEG